MKKLDGKVALVSGGAKKIGRHIAARLAADGAKVAITTSTDIAGAEAAAAELSQDGPEVIALPMQLADRASVDAGVALVMERFGQLDIAVNNGGLFLPGKILDTSTEDWDRVFAVNTRGFFHFATAAARVMKPGSSIISISASSALRCFPGAGGFAASKAAIITAAQQMALEWAPLGLRINTICPGAINEQKEGWEAAAPALAALVKKFPVPRPGKPEEVAEAVAYVIGAEYVNGHVLSVDGGSLGLWYM